MSAKNKAGNKTTPKASADEAKKTEPKAEEQNATPPIDEAKLKRRYEHEQIIDQHLNDSFVIGRSLTVIHDEELYEGDWDGYCAGKWGFSGSHARRLMGAAKCMAALEPEFSPKGEKDKLPKNEAQVRALIDMCGDNSKRWISAWKKVLKSAEGNRLTAEKIKEVLAKNPATVAGDEAKGTGNKAAGANDAEQKLTKIQTLVKTALKAKKPTIEKLKKALENIQEALASK